MSKRKQRPSRGQVAVERALKAVETAGWKVALAGALGGEKPMRYVATKRRTEREDESTTTLYESDYTVEGLAANVARREREEAR